MAKAVFICKVKPAYDDLPEFRYHFPPTYLRQAEAAIGDWILYYESRRDGGRQVYFATARVTRIEPDPQLDDHFYAYVGSLPSNTWTSPGPFRGDKPMADAWRRHCFCLLGASPSGVSSGPS